MTTPSQTALITGASSGIGALIFVGLDNLTGLGTFSLSLGTVPPDSGPTDRKSVV